MRYNSSLHFEVPAAPLRILRLLNSAGYEAYLVGGCVRDALYGKTPHDYDITTNALPVQMQSVFLGLRTIETGLRHGTLTVMVDNEGFEVTTYRVDGEYVDHRRPENVCFTSSLEEDLRRRDFTINAMAYHPDVGLVDPFGGAQDLKAGVIRAVGEPHVRFSEDALRILRALRFSARFGFEIEDATAMAARSLAGTLTAISAERIREEICGILGAPYTDGILREYADVLAVVIPEGGSGIALASLDKDDIVLRLSAYLLKAGSRLAKTALLRLRSDRATACAVESTLEIYEAGVPQGDEQILRTLRAHGQKTLCRALSLFNVTGRDVSRVMSRMEELLRDGACHALAMLAVDGNDLVCAGVPRGRAIGEMLEVLFTAVIRGECPNEREALLAYAVKK